MTKEKKASPTEIFLRNHSNRLEKITPREMSAIDLEALRAVHEYLNQLDAERFRYLFKEGKRDADNYLRSCPTGRGCYR